MHPARPPTTVLVSFLLLASAVLSTHAAAAPGDLDPTFGTGGRVTSTFAGSIETGAGGVLQPDGKIVVAGLSYHSGIDIRVSRYDTSGALDPGFGAGGTTTTDLGGQEGATAVALQPDLKIVVAAANVFGFDLVPTFHVVRYLSDGTLDASFGAGGTVSTPIGGGGSPAALALQSDGKIVVAGEAAPQGDTSHFTLARYESDGSLDATFGTAGIVVAPFADAAAKGLVIQADGKIVVSGVSSEKFAVARFETDGALDATFGDGGVVITQVAASGGAVGVVVEPNGRIVLTGFAFAFDLGVNHNVIATVRYDPDGTPDSTFGAGGIVLTSLGTQGDSGAAILRHPQGELVVAGSSSNSGGGFALVRYLPDGALKPTFGTGGAVVTSMPPGTGVVTTILRQDDGKLVAVGSSCYLQYLCDGSICQSVPVCAVGLARYDDGPCGNGVLDAGETCDDGNALDGDCCSSICQLDAAGVSCTPEGATCLGDVCDGAGTCLFQPTPEGAQCADDGNACTDDRCDGTGVCQHPVHVPGSCFAGVSGTGRLAIKDDAVDPKDKLQWKWTSATAIGFADLGNSHLNGYTLCVIDDLAGTPTIRLASRAPRGGTCAGKPCWKTAKKALLYKDKERTPNGVAGVKLGTGIAGKAKFRVDGKGVELALPAFPFTPPLAVSLHRDDDATRCWESTFSTLTLNAGGKLQAHSD